MAMKKYILPLILLLAFSLRVFSLGLLPAGFTPDEASFGYDAYSIIKTGKDQWGKTFPILFESFGDFKSPVYGYLAVPSVAIFGLTKFAVRLPSAIIGTLAVLIVFLLTKEMSKNKKLFESPSTTAFWASLLLAISPWHIALSRGAFEANLTTFFLSFGVLLFLKGLEKPRLLIWSSVVFGVNLFTYHSAKFVTPVIVLILILLYKKTLFKVDKKLLINSLVIFLFSIVVTAYSFSMGAGRRANDINIYNGSLVQAFDERMRLSNSGYNKYIAHIIYNKYTITLKKFYVNYVAYFSPRFMFIKGPAESTYGMVQKVGVLYWVEVFSLLAFLYSTLRFKNKEGLFLVIWILLSPVPAALSSGVGYAANRVAVMMPAIQIASAFGFVFILQTILKAKPGLKKIAVVFVFGWLAIGFSTFIGKYFLHPDIVIEKQMLSGNLEAINYVSENYPQDKILVSTGLSEPHIYWAFNGRFDPGQYQKDTQIWYYKSRGLPFLDQLPEYKLGATTFKRIDWKKDPVRFDVILGRPDEFPKGILITKVFYYSDATAALYLVETKNQTYAKVN